MVENIRPKSHFFDSATTKRAKSFFPEKVTLDQIIFVMTTKLTYDLDLKTASNSLMPQLARGETILVFKVWKISCKIKELFYKELSSIVD